MQENSRFSGNQELLLNLADTHRSNPISLRSELAKLFPSTESEFLIRLSQSLILSNRLPEKHFPEPFWWINQSLFEMATDYRIALSHAQMIRLVSNEVTDLTTGSGFDSLAFAREGLSVASYETDLVTYKNLELNRELYQIPNWELFSQSGLTWKPGSGGVLYADPLRRNTSGRTYRVSDLVPALADLVRMGSEALGFLVKLSPLFPLDTPGLSQYKKVIASSGRECREVLLLSENFPFPDGTLWIDGHYFYPNREIPSGQKPADGRKLIFEPDPAVLKSGQAELWADKAGLSRPAPDSGYFTGTNFSVEQLFRGFYLIDEQYNTLSDIRKLAQSFSPRPVVLKKKNHNLDLEKYQREIAGKTDHSLQPVYLLVTSHEGRPVVYAAEQIT